MSIGEKIISSVSSPLANAVFSAEVEGATFDSLKNKTVEMLVALDVLASAAHDLENIGKNAASFKTGFETTERRMTENERNELNARYSVPSGIEVPEKEAKEIIGSIDKVSDGVVTQVTDLTGVTHGNLVPLKYVSEVISEEENLQSRLHNDAVTTQQTSIRQPLSAITTLQRLHGNVGGGDPNLSISVFSSPSFKGKINAKDFQTSENFLNTSGLSSSTGHSSYISTALSKSENNEKIQQKEVEKASLATAKKQGTKTSTPQVMVSSGGGGYAMAGGGGAPRVAASFSQQGAFGNRMRRGSQYSEAGAPSSGIITTPSGPTASPTTGTFTSGFGPRWGTNHNGIDIAADIGTPIYAVKDGTVIDSGPAQGFGNWIRIQHDDGTITTYGHMSTLSARVGDEVRAGDYIAGMGSEGQSTGSHLHFEVTDPNGTKVDPLPWLHANGITDWG